MPTDQLLDDSDMDRSLRDLLPPMPRSTGWEASQRDALLTFIETGDIRERPEPTVSDAPLVPLRQSRPDGTRSCRVVVLGMAAAAVLLVAGLVIAPRWRGQDVPPAPASDTFDGGVPFPDVYPVLPVGHPMESRVTALFDGQMDWSNEPQSWMIVGRVVNDVVVEAIRVSATSDPPEVAGAELFGDPTAEPSSALGDQWTLYRDVDDAFDVLVGPYGPATVVIAGSDPDATVAALGGLGFIDVSVDAEDGPFLGVLSLPDGLRVIAGPERLVPGGMSAQLTIPDGEGGPDPTLPDPVGDEGDGITVSVSLVDTFLAPFDGMRRVEIGDAEGWASEMPGAPMVAWKVSETTWATVWDAADTDAALAFARSLEFVDRAAWTERYGVPAPTYTAGRSPVTPPTITPTMPSDAPVFPDAFPIVPEEDARASASTGSYGGVTGWDLADQMHAVVAMDDGARLTNGTVITADPSFDVTQMAAQTAVPITVAGIEGTLFTGGNTRTFVVVGTPTLLVRAADPVAFVEAAGGIPAVDVRVGAEGAATFSLGDLPDGYRAVVEPTVPMAGGSLNAWTDVEGEGDNGAIVIVMPDAYAMTWAVYGDLERVDVDGRPGWVSDRGGVTLIWQVGGTWAMISAPTTLDAVLDVARRVEFVDRATWEQRYDVELGTYPTREEWEMIPATTVPSLIALEEIGGLPSDVPISCGSTPPRDELVDVPAVAATPQAALAAFIDTVEPGLWPNGWIHTWNGEDDDPQHRFDHRRDDGQLVTVVYVNAVDGGWAATRWLSTPC